MSQSILLQTALCLPAPDIEALIQGQMIAAMPQNFINPGQQFALYPTNISINLLPSERYYRSGFLPIAQKVFVNLGSEKVVIKAWAKCEGCKTHIPESFEALSQLTVWTKEALQQALGKRPHIFIAYLRVYQLLELCEIPVQAQSRQFVPLPHSLSVSEANPVLSDRIFAIRKQQLETRQPPEHPELEELQSDLARLSQTNSSAKKLEEHIKIFLGWSSEQSTDFVNSDFVWIQKIAEVGNSSDGYTFEKLVRQGLLKLGFTGSGLAPDSVGGAGGMDFYCEYPYPMVGECKATKSEKVSDGTPAQLLKIGMNHLGKTQYDGSIKLIVAAGELTAYALRTATQNEMNVIRPETLQRLVEMQAQYPGSINLLELKQCLQKEPFGLSDDKVNRYIDKVYQDIKLRSHIVKILKDYLGATKYERAGVEALHGVYAISHPPQPLKSRELHEILVELSSPLTGYVGRIPGEDWRRDRFYFLRDLPIVQP
ncbi:hypothetical protein NUACC21_29290 [Scytonema sp. NUACC21]